ncbi:MAG: FecR domain-containing protein [Sandaracinaceae bacterium]
MSAPPTDVVDRAAALLRASRDVDPEPTRSEDDALLRAAHIGGAARMRTRERRSVMLAAVAGGAMAVAAAIGLWLASSPGARPSPIEIARRTEATPSSDRDPAPSQALREVHPTVLRSERGDRMTATEDARFEVGRRAPAERFVRLDDGAVLFELGPLGDGTFEVQTPDLTVVVTGTIFLVQVDDGRSLVEVFEGHVLVRDAEGEHALDAGQRLGLGSPPRSLREAGQQAARDRLAAYRRPGPARSSPTSERGVVRRRARSARRVREMGPREARTLIVAGRADEALAVARTHADDARWRFVAGDAVRALGQTAAAIEHYEAAIPGLPREEQWDAAYLAARLNAQAQDPRAALAALDAGRVDAADCPLRERALVLRAESLEQLERGVESRAVAVEYLRLYPTGNRAAWMGRIVDRP